MDYSENPGKVLDSKEERFRRLAEQRVNGILDKLRLLGQLANRRNYDLRTRTGGTRSLERSIRRSDQLKLSSSRTHQPARNLGCRP